MKHCPASVAHICKLKRAILVVSAPCYLNSFSCPLADVFIALAYFTYDLAFGSYEMSHHSMLLMLYLCAWTVWFRGLVVWWSASLRDRVVCQKPCLTSALSTIFLYRHMCIGAFRQLLSQKLLDQFSHMTCSCAHLRSSCVSNQIIISCEKFS